MIHVEKLSYSFPEKDLYQEVSFTIEDGQHCVLIGSNGTGKTTLLQLLMHPDDFLYDGKITRTFDGRMGYVSQFEKAEKERAVTVFEFLAEDFVRLQKEMEAVCEELAQAEDVEHLMERYQQILDESLSMDADNYEINIRKELKIAGLQHLEQLPLSAVSGGEYKLLQVIQQILRMPSLLLMDEPDVFLDFDNLKGLRDLVNAYKGTLVAITHNRYLLNHCFDKILHLEDTDIQEFDGTFQEYHFTLLAKKLELQEQAAKEEAEIERNRKLVDKLRADATRVISASRGKALHARVSYLERLEARHIKTPFVELRQPKITFPLVAEEEINAEQQSQVPLDALIEPGEVLPKGKETVLQVEGYRVAFEELLLENVSFALEAGDKAAIVGPNGTGKTTLLRDIYKNQNPFISIAEGTKVGFLSQLHGEMLNEAHTIYEEFEALGFENHAEIAAYLKDYYFTADVLKRRIAQLSGGEKNLLQLAKISAQEANLLLLDEPTSHLDTYAQLALEKAIADYKGTVLMVSHDFYTIINCVDYILFVDDKSIRKMRIRSFRKMIYEKHFSQQYLELEQKKKALEMRIEQLLQDKAYENAKKLCEELEALIAAMKEVKKLC